MRREKADSAISAIIYIHIYIYIYINHIERIQLRMMCASFSGNPSTKIIFCDSPTNDSDKMDTNFYNNLYSLVLYIPKHNFLIICGDMNAQIDKEGNEFC